MTWKKNFANCFPGHVKRRLKFCKTCRNIFAKVRNFSAQGAKITKKNQRFFEKDPQNLHLDSPNSVLTTRADVFLPKVQKFVAQSTKIITKSSLFRKVFLKKFPWTDWLLFWKPCSKFFPNSPKICRSNHEEVLLNVRKLLIIHLFFQRC